MTPNEQSVLIASDDIPLVERILPLLRRSNLAVRRVPDDSRAAETVRREACDLVVVAMPLRKTAHLLAAARAAGSANEHAALLAIVEENGNEAGNGDLLAQANRVLTPDCSPAELQQAVATLLDVAPRAELRAPIRLRLGMDEPEGRVCEVDNLSASGMFIGGVDDLGVGSVFGFELTLPGERQPILGRAQVVRHGNPEREGVSGLGASFLALGGEGPQRVKALVERKTRETAAATPPAEPAPGPRGLGAGPEIPSREDATRDAGEIARHRAELEEMAPYLDELLAKGLRRRFGVADWYVTGAELGLESLGAFYRILEKVYSGSSASPEGERRLTDLRRVHGALSEFARPEQGAEARVRIMLEIRRPLERLLSELSDTERPDEGDDGQALYRGMVAELTDEVVGLIRFRRDLLGLRDALLELQRLRYVFARRTRRRRIEELQRQYRRYGGILAFEGPDPLYSRRRQRATLVAIRRESENLEDRLDAIHDRVYRGRFADRASGDVHRDLGKEALFPVLADVLARGYEYLTRAYSAYRDALEITGSDPSLLERVGRLASVVEAVDRDHPKSIAGGRPPRHSAATH